MHVGGEIADVSFGEGVAAMAQHVRTQHEDDPGPTDQVDVAVPSPRLGTEQVTPRPFAYGSVDVVIPTPRSGAASSGAAAPEQAPEQGPERAPVRTPSGSRARTTLLVAGSVVAALLVLSGLYTASTVRERSLHAAPPAAVLHDVTYSIVTGHGSAVVVDYTRSDGPEYASGSADDVPSPWHLGTRVNDEYGPTVSAAIVSEGPDGAAVDDSITCTIVEDGRTVAQETGSGPGASVSCTG